MSSTEAELYFKTGTPTEILPLQDLLTKEVEEKYPLAVISFSPPETDVYKRQGLHIEWRK